MLSFDPASLCLGPHFWTRTPLLLTATIRVADGLVDSSINDPRRREREYLDCLQFYLTQAPLSRVVFVENSGANLDAFRRVPVPPEVRLEVVSLDQNVFPREFGKGYGEAQLIDAALTHSTLLTEAPAFIKATGRLIVRNVAALLHSVDHTASGHFDVRDHDLYERLKLPGSGHHADTRFFAVRRDLFEAHFRALHTTHTSGTFSLEARYLRALREARAAGWRVRDRFAIEPVYGGTAGHGKDYDALPERTKRAIRSVVRRWFPNMKI